MSDTSWNVSDYPEPTEATTEFECDWCGFALTNEVYEYDGKVICAKCYLERILDDLGLEGIADELGHIHKSKETYMEECYGY